MVVPAAVRAHQQFIRLHLALLSPVRALPLDILGRIFAASIEACEQMHGHTELKRTGRRHPIVDITHVCREWRELAIGTPSLWVYVRIDSLPSLRYGELPLAQIRLNISRFNRSIGLVLKRVTAFVSRAAPLPIILSFTGADPHTLDDPTFLSGITPLIDLLRGATWRSVSFKDVQTTSSPLLRLLPVPTKSVDTIQVVKVRIFETFLGRKASLPSPRRMPEAASVSRPRLLCESTPQDSTPL